MDPYSIDTYLNHGKDLASCTNLTDSFVLFLQKLLFQSELQNKFSKPMLWMGIYAAIASLFCILPMVADLLHGLKHKKLWFPCKYFTLNAASLTVIAVAMKLPMDVSNSMQNDVDQDGKLGSMAFMCTMMANLLPSLATMDSKELITNIIALGVLVITLVVNVYIQIETGAISYLNGIYYSSIACMYVVMLLALLMIHTCSALMILKSKQILESKYKAGHETKLKDLELQQPGRVTVEKLEQHVSNHWIMAETSSPQFMTVCSATTSASGVICVSSTVIHVINMLSTRPNMKYYGSDYKWSVSVIFIIQFSGVILGTIAPILRCLASLSFKVSIKWIWNHIRVFKAESCYTQKLSDWKHSSIPFRFSNRRCKIVIQDLKVLILSFLIGFQKMVVVTCKMIALIPIFFVICILCCFHCWKWLKVMFGASLNVSVEEPAQLQHTKDLSRYVLQLQDDMEFAGRTLKSISKSVNRVIQKAKKQQPNNLMKLLEECSGFEGVGKYDVHQVPSLPEEKYVDCWSLPVVTLTTIAISLPNVQKDMVDGLLRSVSEGLTYVTLVEETLNATDEFVIIQNAARRLWLEVEVYHKWLGNKLQNPSHQVNPAREIVQWFSDTAKNMVTEVENKNIEGSNDDSLYISVSAKSMYRITQTILVSYHDNIDQISQEDLFVQISSMISHMLAACLTNLPQVIAMKCHTNVIEKREASVHTAAQLLGETMHIINNLQDRQLPNLKPDELPFIDKWRDLFLHPSP
ncbi:hypothetical protein L1987_62435 [Smallanthus sonchifolius]|uniref:Uncharacterized protein n=1 Tax=Smallanthus sonchifolius TaxID=185202 RepID=A0ACB9CAQ0_9ASTR|nr:hypothetical protein L1987_62435 [Smallanthus sonchifolius]